MAHSIRPIRAAAHIDAIAYARAILAGDLDAQTAILSAYRDGENPLDLADSLTQCLLATAGELVGRSTEPVDDYLRGLDRDVREAVRIPNERNNPHD